MSYSFKSGLVSSIIIFLNEERFVGEAIESVLSQSYPHWELLLVDDGSSDGSTALAQRYAASYPKRIRYLEHPGHANRGMSASRNLGISQARGEYLAFLDADDIWLPHKLERQVATLQAYPAASMVYGPVIEWYSWTDTPVAPGVDAIQELGVVPGKLFEPPKLFCCFLAERGKFGINISNALLRRTGLISFGGFEDKFRHQFEDKVLFARITLNSPVFVVAEVLSHYRQHAYSSSVFRTQTGEYHPLKPNPAHCAYLEWLEHYLVEQGIKDSLVWKILRQERWPYHHPRLYAVQQQVQQWVRMNIRRVIPRSLRHWVRKCYQLSRAGNR
jgi:glycosyltransferase involved in cell wall biosynthesis